MTEKQFKLLSKIKRPVLIFASVPWVTCGGHRYRKQLFKVRVLYPSGKCIYTQETVDPHDPEPWDRSCFAPPWRNLDEVLRAMREWDASYTKIFHIETL